jgi:hypothetical protein
VPPARTQEAIVPLGAHRSTLGGMREPKQTEWASLPSKENAEE